MHNSDDLGYNDTSSQGTVFRKTLGHYGIHVDGKVVICSISNKLRKRLIYPIADPASIRPHVIAVADIREVDPIAIGDVVQFVDAGDGTGMITEVLPRKNKLVRYASGPKPLEQVIVANVDQIVTVLAAAQPAPNWRMLDRYLATAEEADIPARICITKMDVAEEETLMKMVCIYQDIGYAVILTSARSGRGVDEFKQVLKGRVSVFVGMSGVGKTSLLNAMQPGLGLRVKEISQATGKGRHATSHLEMFALDLGGSIADTPGMKLFGLWHIDEVDLASLFVEMQPYVGRCRFGVDCSHDHEPGCAIKEAVKAGCISTQRYESYLRMRGYLYAKEK